MALPTGSITFANLNTALGLSSTASIDLNNAKVRSLASLTSGAINMSSLQGKSTAWLAMTSGSSSPNEAPNVATSPNAEYCYRLFYDSSLNNSFLQKVYLNGSNVAQVRVNAASFTPSYIYENSAGNVYLYLSYTSLPYYMYTYRILFNSSLVLQSAQETSSFAKPLGIAFYSANESFAVNSYVPSYVGAGELTYFTSAGAGIWKIGLGVGFGAWSTFDSSGNIYFTNTVYGNAAGYTRITLHKATNAGVAIWSRGATGGLPYRGVALSASDGAVAFGNIGTTLFDQGIVAYDSAGTFQWGARLNATFTGGFSYGSLLLSKGIYAPDGFLYFVGTCREDFASTASNQIIVVYKVSTGGTLQWCRSLRLQSGFGFGNMGADEVDIVVQNNAALITNATNTNFSFSMPTDGSGTGTYTAGSYQVAYSTPASTVFTAYTPTTATAAPFTKYGFTPASFTTVTVTTATPSNTVTATAI